MSQEEVNRKLSCILSTDVVGYSRLMEENETSTVRYLEENKKLISNLIEQHNGRVVDSPGDNLLAEFSSAVKAVDCSVKIQKELKIKNAELVENRRMQFRIGINLGDVIEEDGRLYGSGVNIAARLESLADPGGICLSRNVYDQVKTKLDLGYEYLGEHIVKNISEPVRVYRVQTAIVTAGNVVIKKVNTKPSYKISFAITLIIILAWLLTWRFCPNQFIKTESASVETEQTAVPEVKDVLKSIAVLPFDDLSPKKDQEYFVDGLSEEILNSLTQIPNLRVIAKTSSFSFKDQNKTVQEIAKVLGVDHVLEGSVRRSGNTIRITAQLIKASDESHLWSDVYEKDLGVKELFAVQEDIANNVADKLKLTLEAFQLLGGTENIKAYELYLNAKGKRAESNVSGYKSALVLLDQAIALDSKFAVAWSYKAHIHIMLSVFGPASQSTEERNDSRRAAEKAIGLEPNLAEAYINLIYGNGLSKNMWIDNEQIISKALGLIGESLSGDYHLIIPFYLAVGKFKKAYELLEEMKQNDPLNPEFHTWYYPTYSYLDDRKSAEEKYEHRNKAQLKDYLIYHDDGITKVRLGSGEKLSRSDIISSEKLNLTLKEYIDSQKEGLEVLHRIYENKDYLANIERSFTPLWAAYFGDLDFAMEIIEDTDDTLRLWFPIMKEIRQTGRFKEYIRKTGLVDYWKTYGWPDLCRPVGDDDFVCE